MPLLNKAALDRATGHGCSVPGCTHDDHDTLFLHGRCHLGGGVEVSYKCGTGVLCIGCNVCSKIIAEIKVAD